MDAPSRTNYHYVIYHFHPSPRPSPALTDIGYREGRNLGGVSSVNSFCAADAQCSARSVCRSFARLPLPPPPPLLGLLPRTLDRPTDRPTDHPCAKAPSEGRKRESERVTGAAGQCSIATQRWSARLHAIPFIRSDSHASI